MYRTSGCRIWFALASLLLSVSDWKLQSLVVLLSDAFSQGFDESDCKLQNLVRFDLSSLLLRVVPGQSRHSTCQESSRCQVSSATPRSDAAVRMKFLTSLKIGTNFVRKEVACHVGVKHEESLHKFCLARA